MCDRVAVMYAGRIVECGPVRQIFEAPSHPYTQALIASVPKMTGTAGRLTTIEGQPPSLMDLPVGCRFALALRPMSSSAAWTPIPAAFGSATSTRPTAGGSRRHDRRAAAAGRASAQALPLHQGHPVRRARSATSRRWTTSPSTIARRRNARAWWANSGCGKTTTSTLILNLEEPTEGRILLEGEPIHGLQGEALRAYRARCRRCSRIPGRRSTRA